MSPREQSSILENITNKEVNTLPAANAQPPKPRGPLKDIVDGQQTMDGRKIVYQLRRSLHLS